MTILNITHLTKKFGGLTAVNDLSFHIETGEILGLIGPNGAGKTTVFASICGFLTPDNGEIRFNGQSILGKLPFEICDLGMVRTFQIVKPFPAISVLDNVMIGALLRTDSVQEARQQALKIIDFTGLGKMKDQEAKGLPLPLRKRLELARAMATQPRLLLLDEVMAGLNPTEVDELIKLIQEINRQGVSIFMIEHVMRGVMALSHRVIVISYGQKIAEGKPKDVVMDKTVIEAYLGKEFVNAESE